MKNDGRIVVLREKKEIYGVGICMMNPDEREREREINNIFKCNKIRYGQIESYSSMS